ncbi:MAG TPA: C4-dicarboxylate ABC transporter, partial [Pseudomonas sp.]|nr:C4-dicarboxylate ABC transporter [Pseudomonas sp.]
WAMLDARRKGFRFGAAGVHFSLRDKLAALPRILPLMLIILGVLYVLYGGVATPSEAAGAGAMLTLVVVVLAYRLFKMGTFRDIFGSGMRESVMIMMILASAELFAFALSSLYITQSLAEAIASLEVNRWVLMGVINVFLLVAGMFLPPVAVIVMSAPLLFP